MLPRANRLTSGEAFSATVRTGRRSGCRTMVVHWSADHVSEDEDGCVRVGFVVSKAVGNAVTRNRVARRLRHVAASRVSALPAPGVLVVRALVPAAEAGSAELARDLDRCLRRVTALDAA